MHEGGGHSGGQSIPINIAGDERRAIPQNLDAGDEICANDLQGET